MDWDLLTKRERINKKGPKDYCKLMESLPNYENTIYLRAFFLFSPDNLNIWNFFSSDFQTSAWVEFIIQFFHSSWLQLFCIKKNSSKISLHPFVWASRASDWIFRLVSKFTPLNRSIYRTLALDLPTNFHVKVNRFFLNWVRNSETDLLSHFRCDEDFFPIVKKKTRKLNFPLLYIFFSPFFPLKQI